MLLNVFFKHNYILSKPNPNIYNTNKNILIPIVIFVLKSDLFLNLINTWCMPMNSIKNVDSALFNFF